MTSAYTPGLQVTARTRYRARRVLPIAGEVLVGLGDRVEAREIVAQTALPGDATPINLANQLSLPPGDVPGCMLKQEGDTIEVGDVLARTNGIFGFFKNEFVSHITGRIESISSITGQLIVRGAPIPVQVSAYVTGDVVEVFPEQGVVVEAEVSFVQGIFGVGGEAFGPIRMACQSHAEEFTPDLITGEMRGGVVIGGARMSGATVRRAIEVGAAAVVSGGIDDADLREILGYDLGVAITGTEQIGITLIVTEGFGEIAMAERTFQLLASRVGADAAVNGATQIRAGVLRPEIVIPLPEAAAGAHVVASTAGGGVLEEGTQVRIIRDPHFGVIGKVVALPAAPQVLGSGSRARVLEVQCETGDTVVVPRANVEIIGGGQ